MEKYKGIIPAFYAVYDEKGEVCTEGTKKLVEYFISAGVLGLYVCGSSGECIYQSVEDRKKTLESVMEVAKGKLTIIAHVACNNTKDSIELAKHAESLSVDAIASIPPIYFRLPEESVMKYWNDISNSAPNTDFFIYNIPQLAGTTLTNGMLLKMLENPNVKGVKNSSMPVLDIQQFKAVAGADKIIFNGPDEQLVSGVVAGAEGGIGGTYGACPELYIKMFELVKANEIEKAQQMQNDAIAIIIKLCSAKGHMYAVIKEVIKQRTGIDCGGVREPLRNLDADDMKIVTEAKEMIETAMKKYL